MRYAKTTILVAAVFILPLLGTPDLMIDPRIIGLAIAGIVLILSQPDFSAGEARQHKVTDRMSMAAIFYGGLLSYIVPIVDWAHWGIARATVNPDIMLGIGATLIVGGLAVRIWAIRVLGRFFTATVQIVEGHRLVTSGPYGVVRHPSYTGAYMAIVGHAFVLGSALGIAFAAITMFAAYRLRIEVEEQVLVGQFGTEYQQYRRRSWRLVPLVW